MTFIGSGPKPPGVAAGPIFQVTSDDGSIVVTDGGGPVVDLATRTTRYASIEIFASDITVPNGGVLPTVFTEVPFNILGPANVLLQTVRPSLSPAGITVPDDEDGIFDIEYTLTLSCDQLDPGNPGIWIAFTLGGDPAAGGTILVPSLTVYDIVSNLKVGATDITYSVCTSMLRQINANEKLSVYMTGLNPVGSDPLHFSQISGSMEAIRLQPVFPV